MQDERTILDLILEKAESILKQTMTSFHLVYGYAYVCKMQPGEVCKELGFEEKETEKVAYMQYKWDEIFSSAEINRNVILYLLPQYIEKMEENEEAEEDYEKAMNTITQWHDECDFSEDVVAYGLLYNLLLDGAKFHTSGLYQMYFKRNLQFYVSQKQIAEIEQYNLQMLGEIAAESEKLYTKLTETIIGQDIVIQKFINGYTNARLGGRDRKHKPQASYLFAGPPGVGKTFLARTIAQTLNRPIKILDMSEYVTEHQIEGLTGFDYTYRNAKPGMLTTFVMQNPDAIILVDEIEKAHVSIQLLFLQLLEGARMYDKYLQKEINFENTMIIFTTNAGKELYEENENTNLSALPETEVLESLREDETFPRELCSRFASGNILMFNHLPIQHLCKIVRMKMEQTIEDLKKGYGIDITFDRQLPELLLFHIGKADARICSAKAAVFIKESVIAFIKNAMQKQEVFQTQEVSIELELKKQDDEIYSLFEKETDSKILVISEDEKFDVTRNGLSVLFAKNEEEMLQIIWENEIAFAIVDLSYHAAKGTEQKWNVTGIESVGRKCLELLQEKAPNLSVYIVELPSFHMQDKKELLNLGVCGFFAEQQDSMQTALAMETIAKQLSIQKQVNHLAHKGINVEYQMRFYQNGKSGKIELYGLTLHENAKDDAALRRKAKKSKVFDFERPTIRFDDIIGAESVKRDFKHFIRYIRNIDKYVLQGAEVPKGCLLYGPPGTGKTSLAKALAGECDVMFLNTTGANIRNASNGVQEIQDLFKIAYANAPAILFIDEIDVIAKERKGYDTGTELLVNTLLTEMEGFSEKDPFKPVFVIAATNYQVKHRTDRPDEVVIDPALVRRFDNPIYVGLPNRKERKQYMQRLLEKKKYTDKISEVAVDYVAEHTGGKSFAFLQRVVSNMTNIAIDMDKEINDDLLTDTLETQLYGEKRECDEETRLNVARHEAGHAYVSWKTKREPKFITIVSRGTFGGYVSYGDGEETTNLTKEDFLNRICQALAGRAAEQVYNGQEGVNTGAGSDLEKATAMAMHMICSYGMGEMGLLAMDESYFLHTPKSTEVLEEARHILDTQYHRAVSLIKDGKAVIDNIVEVLMDQSYIQSEKLNALLEESEQKLIHSKNQSLKQHKWYVVLSGRKTGVYTTWEECSEQVKGYHNAVYRAFESEEAALAAYYASWVGVRNIRDKKLLYHLVRLSDMERILKDGLKPDMQVGEKKYVGFDFYAYASDAVKKQQEHCEEVYVHVCILREYAIERGYEILLKQPQEETACIYPYPEGFSKINWDAMENRTKKEQQYVQCVTDKTLSCEEISYLYVPDEQSAAQLREICKKFKNGKNIVINVNRRMFI